MFVAHKLNVHNDNADDPIHIVGCGMLTACDFVEDDALGTRGTARVLEEKGIDLEEVLIVSGHCLFQGRIQERSCPACSPATETEATERRTTKVCCGNCDRY